VRVKRRIADFQRVRKDLTPIFLRAMSHGQILPRHNGGTTVNFHGKGHWQMAPSRPDHFVFAKALRYRVLEGPGVTDPVTRKAAAERASGGPAIEASYDDLVRQIGELSHRVTSAQVEQLVREVGSEKAAFEVIVAAAMGAGLLRWESAIKVLDEASDASAGN
jgi:hypothetical protein